MNKLLQKNRSPPKDFSWYMWSVFWHPYGGKYQKVESNDVFAFSPTSSEKDLRSKWNQTRRKIRCALSSRKLETAWIKVRRSQKRCMVVYIAIFCKHESCIVPILEIFFSAFSEFCFVVLYMIDIPIYFNCLQHKEKRATLFIYIGWQIS